MIVLIGMLCGLYNLPALLMAFALIAVMDLCGLMVELHMALQHKKVGPWRDYIIFGERIYILLSLIAKPALAWQVFANTLRPV